MKISKSNITALLPNEIFIFGSNLSGIHGGGAAKTALQWGAQMGNGVGAQGSTYAIPTKSHGIKRSLTIAEIKPYVDQFIDYAMDHKELNFLLTEIGCGLAGNEVKDIAPLFARAFFECDNVYMPVSFVNYFTSNTSLS